MERIGLVRDQSGDFDHPRVDPDAFPDMVRHVLYRLDRGSWRRSVAERESGATEADSGVSSVDVTR
jgi:hypothetical protein